MSRWRKLGRGTQDAQESQVAATSRCAESATKRGVSGGCMFKRTTAVKTDWDNLNRKTAKIERKLNAVDNASILVLGDLGATLVPVNVNTSLITWEFIKGINCLSAANIITTNVDQYVKIKSHGLYTVTCQLRWNINSADITSTSVIDVSININSNTHATGTYHPAVHSFANCIVTTSVMLDVGDEIRVYARQTTNGSQTVSSTNGTIWTVQKH